MSRSNPTTAANPSTRWFKWSGADGTLKFYDKAKEKEVAVKLPFTFMFLDELATIKGWHDASGSGIFSNEVRSTQEEKLTVKAFNGGELAQGLYADIKDKVNAAGGKYTANIYIAYKDDSGELSTGCLQLKGASLGAWMEYKKAHRGDINNKAVSITGSKDGKKGSVKFKTPEFSTVEITAETNAKCLDLDRSLQEYLSSYLTKKVVEAPQDANIKEADEEEAEVVPTNKMPF